MTKDPAMLGLIVAKKKPPMGAPPPLHDTPDAMNGGASSKPKVDISIKPKGDDTDPDAATGADDGTAGDPHSNLDEIMSGDPKVASAVSALLKALCDEEKAEGDYGDGADSGLGAGAGAELQ